MEVSAKKLSEYIRLVNAFPYIEEPTPFDIDCTPFINTKSHLRKSIKKDELDYAITWEYRNLGHGEFKYASVNGHGQTLEFFNEIQDGYTPPDWVVKRAVEDRDRQYKRDNKDAYIPLYEEANFVHKLIYRGFIPRTVNGRFTPYDNWFGVSAYSPDLTLKRGKKFVKMSLQGVSIPFDIPEDRAIELAPIFKERACRYMCFVDGDNMLYETFTGELPSNEFITEFSKQ